MLDENGHSETLVTWEDPVVIDEDTKCKGDGDPVDVCEIGHRVANRGEVLQVKVLGIIGLVDEGETDWKVIAINVHDPLAEKLNDILDVDEYMPGFVEETIQCFRCYKIPDGKPEIKCAVVGQTRVKDYALKIIEKTHGHWKHLIEKKNERGFACPYKISSSHATAILSKHPKFRKTEPVDLSTEEQINGAHWLRPLDLVKNAENLLEIYDAVGGLECLTSAATRMLLGADSIALKEKRALGVQSISGTGALRIAADFLATVPDVNKVVYISNPTCENHHLLFLKADFTDVREYRYWDAQKRGLDLQGLVEDLQAAEERSVVILHACAHNPTGVDPTQEQWKKIVEVVKERHLFPVLDSAYQGFASGDPDANAWAVRYFVQQGIEFVCAQSFAKTFGRGCEDFGLLTMVFNEPKAVCENRSAIAHDIIFKYEYPIPEASSGRMISTIITDCTLIEQWKDHIKSMSGRMKAMREQLREKLEALKTPGSWKHLTDQIGMFAYTGLTVGQCDYLIEKHHIYLLRSGRINVCGVTLKNVDHVAHAIYDAVSVIRDDRHVGNGEKII